MNYIFLSASIPVKDRNPKYFTTVDVLAIREAIRALVTVVLPKTILVWGGHPAITPIIRTVSENLNLDCKNHLILYQSNWFEGQFPQDNDAFQKVIYTKKKETIAESLKEMRKHMIEDYAYKAGIFIGGMEGVQEEFDAFSKEHPKARLLPVASTGAAAKIIYNSQKEKFPEALERELTYMNMFKTLLKEIIE